MAITLRFTPEHEMQLIQLCEALDCPTKSKALLYLLENHERLLAADRDLQHLRKLSKDRARINESISYLIHR